MLKVGLPIALAIIMFGMGLGLTMADFMRVFSKPKAFLLGAGLQILMLPLLVLLLLLVFPLSAPLAAGLMILAACPGGVTSNILTYLARGDVALSVSLTAVISLLGFITVPIITDFALSNYMGEGAPELPIAKTMIGILLIITVPVALGMLVRKLKLDWAVRMEKVFGPLSIFVFVAVIIGALIAERENVVSYIAQAGLHVIALNILAMFVAISAAKLFMLPKSQRSAIALECGLQNGTLGLAITITILGRTDIGVPSAVYGLLMLFTGFGYAMWLRSRQVTAENE